MLQTSEDDVNVRGLIILFLLIGAVSASDEGVVSGSTVKIGILDFEQFGYAVQIADKAQSNLTALITDIGFYTVFGQDKLVVGLEKIRKKMPFHCRDPRCVLDLGMMLGMDRMIFGSVDFDNDCCGVRLTLMDVLTRQTIETVSLEGAPGVPVTEVLKVAVAKLHGQKVEAANMSGYYGPLVHHEKEWLISSAATIGAGLLYGGINYGVEQSDVSAITAVYKAEELSGIPTTGVPIFARPAALGNAYVAASNDAYGVLYNPAGMAWVAGPQTAVAYQYRFGLDNIAATYVNKATRDIGFGQALLYRSDREQLMTEMAFISAFAYKFNRLPGNIRPFSLGVNLKILGNRVRSTSELSPGGSSFGAGFDVGLRWELSDQICYGLLLRDLPVINYWKNVKTGYSYAEAEAATLHMGGTFQAGYSTFLIAEGQIPLYEDQRWKMAGGIEQELFDVFQFRIGAQKEILSMVEASWRLTCGFGIAFGSIELDGSYEYNTNKMFDVINVSVRYEL